MTAIGSVEINVLLNLLEARVLRFTGATLVDTHGDRGRALIDAGLMIPAGSETVGFDCVDQIREVIFDPDRGEHGIQDPRRGWVRIERTALALYAPDIGRIFGCLLGDSFRDRPGGAVALDGDVVWQIGSANLGRSTPTEIWFSRRLHDPRCEKRLEDLAERRPATDRRLVLTSTASTPSTQSIFRTTVVPIADALSWATPAKIDIAILEARLDGRTCLKIAQAVYLSDDNGTLYIHGEACVVFKGKTHKRIARRLVDAHNKGKPIKAAEVLASAGSKAGSFDQAFGPKWRELRRYLHHDQGYWRFEV
jgi:hypothetical protein